MAKKEKDILQEGPGPVKDSEKPQVPNWRGESGTSDAKGSDETDSVHYGR